jgi:hypothetical protein
VVQRLFLEQLDDSETETLAELWRRLGLGRTSARRGGPA